MFVVYTGSRQDRPERISLKNSFFSDGDSCLEVEAKVIYDSKQGDILDQFIKFSKVFDRQRKRYGVDLKRAVQEAIRICRKQNILADYLQEEEAAAVMFTFADQEREFERALRKERIQGKLDTLIELVEKGSLTWEEAASEANMSVDQLKEEYPTTMS